MDLTIVALYTICDDLLISIGHKAYPQAKMSDAEVMTAALIATSQEVVKLKLPMAFISFIFYFLPCFGYLKSE